MKNQIQYSAFNDNHESMSSQSLFSLLMVKADSYSNTNDLLSRALVAMKTKAIKTTLAVTALAFNPMANATLSEAMIEDYNQAAQGNEEKVDVSYEQINGLIAQEGVDALSLVYLGSTQTLMGRDAFMPWNKMKYTEEGLATIAKGLSLLSDETASLDQQDYRQGLPQSFLATAIAATTYTSLPDMFNHFERGYDLYLDLLSDPDFSGQSYQATAWVYLHAIQAALRAEDKVQGQKWLEKMQDVEPQHPLTIQAEAIINGKA